MMKRIINTLILCVAAVANAAAAFNLTASKVTIQDLTVDKYNFFVTVEASTSSGEYEVAFDVWPATRSAIGSFSSNDKTIGYVSSYVHKTKANGSAVNMWYDCYEDSPISLSIVSNGDGTCTLSGSITATRNNTAYTYNIAEFTFDYEEGPVTPDPGQDPYRFEPATPTTINFIGDVVNFRERTGYIEVTLNEMANETYDWIELRLLSDELAMPAGDYTINDSDAKGSLTASKGYLGSTLGDDPCYVAIRADKEDWGQYTPYYLESGTLNVAYNAKGDTIFVTGTAISHNGSTINVNVRSYNMLYDPYAIPPEPEFVTLAIDTVMVTYRSDLSDSTANTYQYTFNFFYSQSDYPNVLVDAILKQPMQLEAGTYTLEANELSGLALFQNQEDYNSWFFGGEPYVFETARLTLTEGTEGKWTYAMFITDTLGSEYNFSFSQAPHIVHYPQSGEETDPKDKPYADELKQTATISATMDVIEWKTTTVEQDGILDIILTQQAADVNGLRAYLHLGMYTSVAYPEAGAYPVNDSETEGSFSASLGRFGNTLIPCYLMLMDGDGWAHSVWYIVNGTINLSYNSTNQPILSGECTSYFGSTIRFSYSPIAEGIEEVESGKVKGERRKVIENGQLYLMYEGAMYDVQGRKMK